MAEGRAFVSRRNNGKQGSTFVGYERILPQYTGMVLLDATADIDGVTKLCPRRKCAADGEWLLIHCPGQRKPD
jgi:hypothetical protein